MVIVDPGSEQDGYTQTTRVIMEIPLLSILILSHFVMNANSQGITQCGVCRCIYIEPHYSADCEGLGLETLPLFDETVTIVLNEVYLKDNKLVELDQNIIDSWYNLEYMDLSNNYISCEQMGKISDVVKIDGVCYEQPPGK